MQSGASIRISVSFNSSFCIIIAEPRRNLINCFIKPSTIYSTLVGVAKVAGIATVDISTPVITSSCVIIGIAIASIVAIPVTIIIIGSPALVLPIVPVGALIVSGTSIVSTIVGVIASIIFVIPVLICIIWSVIVAPAFVFVAVTIISLGPFHISLGIVVYIFIVTLTVVVFTAITIPVIFPVFIRSIKGPVPVSIIIFHKIEIFVSKTSELSLHYHEKIMPSHLFIQGSERLDLSLPKAYSAIIFECA